MLKSFGPVIKTNLGTPPTTGGRGVDISKEERLGEGEGGGGEVREERVTFVARLVWVTVVRAGIGCISCCCD